jgi:hypothetical protein
MRILHWHVHGSWTTSFVHGDHEVLLPVLPDRGPDGRGRAETWDWPPNAIEVTPREAADADVDVVVLQRPEELHGLAAQWLGGRRPGRDVPAVYVEHNTPQGRINDMRHPVAHRADIPLVHVTHFNAMLWDSGDAPVHVVEHGIVDPGHRYTGELDRAVAVANEPGRRARVAGTDLLPRFRSLVPVDLFGMRTEAVGGRGNLSQADLHDVIGQRRLYLHPYRWTSLGLSMLEAMHVGMPVVCLSTTEAPEVVPPEAGIVSNDWDVLARGIRELRADADHAREVGEAARKAALDRFGLDRFHRDWDAVLEEVTA